MDYYELLGVERNASTDEIKKAYRKKAVEHHPDKNNGSKEAEEMFKKIAESYFTLSDDNRRRRYDMSLQGAGAFVFTDMENVEFTDVLNDFFKNPEIFMQSPEKLMEMVMRGLSEILNQKTKQR